MSSTNYVNYSVNINSKDRINAVDPPGIATFKINDLINLNSRKRAYLTMPYVNIPPTWLNVTASNNTVTVHESTWPAIAVLSYLVTIPTGNYAVAGFINALTSAMTSMSAISGYALTYTGSYNASTGLETIQITPANPTHTFTYEFNTTINNDLKPFMGFSSFWNGVGVPFPLNQTPAQPNSYTFISPDVVNFSAVMPAVYVRCSIYRTDTCYDTSDGPGGSGGDILAIVPITGNAFSQITLLNGYEGIEDKRVEVNNILNSNITFTLTSDDKNFILDTAGWDWQAVLLIEYSRESK